MVATVTADKVRIRSRNGRGWTQRLADLAGVIGALGLDDADLDGEIVVLRDGRSDINALQARLAGQTKERPSFALFDAPMVDGRSLRQGPLIERKEALHQLLGQRKFSIIE